jgi:arylformamidase
MADLIKGIQMLIDVSMPITRETQVYPGDRRFEHYFRADFQPGEEYSASYMIMSAHTATHMDSPYHFNRSGWRMGDIPLALFSGLVDVVRIAHGGAIETADLPEVARGQALFLQTPALASRIDPASAYLSLSGAARVLDLGYKLIGIDQMSMDRIDSDTFPVHKMLMGKNMPFIENLRLGGIEAGHYEYFSAPLNIPRAEAAPCRVFFRKL